MNKITIAATVATAALFAACGGDSKTPAAADSTAGSEAPPAASASNGWSASALTPTGSGKVVVVKAMTDDKGVNRFEPAKFEVHQGDVIRFTLESGVHNVHFLPDSNAGKRGFPTAPTDLLQLPGQTFDVLVNWPEGTYYFQCDPHALLGMQGHVKVED